jgi:hypothetical protein
MFTPVRIAPTFIQRSKQGHATTRKPRNTCHDCNTEWMSKIEGASKLVALQLIRGQSMVLSIFEQMTLASLLCLIVMRYEFLAVPRMVAVPDNDRDWLRAHHYPPWRHWKIWVARYDGPADQLWAYHLPMHIDSRTAETGPHKVNTQSTTLVIGQICAHAFSSTEIDFGGFRGIQPARIWPPCGQMIDWAAVPAYGDEILLSWAEALNRDIPTADQ